MKKFTTKLLLFLNLLLYSTLTFALSIDEVASKKEGVGAIFVDGQSGINNTLTGTTKAIIAIAAVVGFLVAAKGLHMMYRASQPQTQDTYTKGLIAFLVGGALVSLPFLVFTSSNTVQALQ